MSDYGFKTLKNGSGTSTDTAISAKMPIMGFDLSHRPSTYITFHITDAKTNPIADSSTPGYTAPSLPSVSSLSNVGSFIDIHGTTRYIKGGANIKSGYVRTLIHQQKHGYKFRPACYGTFTGKIVKGVRTKAIGNGPETSPAGKLYFDGNLYNGNWNLMSSFNTATENTETTQLISYMNRMNGIYGAQPDEHMFIYTLSPSSVPSPSENSSLIKPAVSALTYMFYKNYITSGEYPYSFEVDDEYIKIYRTYYWNEIYGRVYFDETMATDDVGNMRYELKDFLKVQQVEQLTGSEVDVNIMLFPYKMEDLI